MPNVAAEHVEWSKEVIERQIKNFTRMIDGLLDVSRITLDKIELSRQRIDASSVINSAVDAVRPLIEEKTRSWPSPSRRARSGARWTRMRLEQILINLLTNAMRYTPANGQIQLWARNEGSSVTFRVEDNGIGIPPDQLSHMFELFAQGDRTITRSDVGLGIGLTIVIRIAELHGGTAAAFSEGPGMGSQFTVTLPAIPTPQIDALPAPVATPSQTGGSRILIIDDNVDMATGLGQLLNLSGYIARTAHDGSQAITEALAFRPGIYPARYRPARHGWLSSDQAAPGGRASRCHHHRRLRLRPGGGPPPLPRRRIQPPPGQAGRSRCPHRAADRTEQRVMSKNPHRRRAYHETRPEVRPLLRARRSRTLTKTPARMPGGPGNCGKSPGCVSSPQPRRSVFEGRPMLITSRQMDITNALGLHLRAASIRQTRPAVPGRLRVICDGRKVSGKSILDLATLAAACLRLPWTPTAPMLRRPWKP